MSEEFKAKCQVRRDEIEAIKNVVRDEMMDCVVECGPEDLGEVRANVKLAYRHFEDARMRFGKAIQAADGGVSIYDSKPSMEVPKMPASECSTSKDGKQWQDDKPVVAGEKAGKDD